MKLYTCTGFKGFWPVGTAAVMVASTQAEAKEMLEAELAKLGLHQTLPMDEIVNVNLSKAAAHILLDGNY
jgi:hypothetical protein